jgi:transposase
MTTATTPRECIAGTPTLFCAIETGGSKWHLAFTVGVGQRSRHRVINARDTVRLMEEIEQAKRRFNLSATACVRSCYEAGREGFWLHRWLSPME